MNLSDSALTGFSTHRLPGDGHTDLLPDEPILEPLSDFLSVDEGHCHWPLDALDPLECCGRQSRPGSPYCEHHHHRAYHKAVPMTEAMIAAAHHRGMAHVKSTAPRAILLNALHSAEDMGL